MANQKLTDLTAASTPLAGTEQVYVVQSGNSRKATTQDLADLAGEWSAETVTQVEAEAGTATTRRAFTAQRVFQAVAAWWAASSANTKLDGIAAGATLNSSDATLLNRANHTGTQTAGTITGLASVATSGAYADLSGTPTLGTAAAANVGTSAGNVVQLDGDGKLPAVDGSALTGLSVGGTPGGSDTQLQYNNGGSFGGLSTLTTDGTNITLSGRFISSLNGAASAPPASLTGTWFTGGTATTTKPQFLIEPAGTTSTAWSTSGTGLGINAPSGFTGNLLDLQVNGTSRVAVNSAGQLTLANGSKTAPAVKFAGSGNVGIFFRPGVLAEVTNGANAFFSFQTQAFLIAANTGISWSSSFPDETGGDVTLYRDAAGILAQRADTVAQAFRCYGTYTDASNYVRAALSSTSTAVTLAAETAGTGADDIPLNLTAAGTGTVKVNSVAEVAVSSTVAGLPASPAVGMLTRVTDADAPAVGSTVAGGGAAAALVWWNGSTWTVIGV